MSDCESLVDPSTSSVASVTSVIRAKAERIVELLSKTKPGDAQAVINLSLAEELAQDIAGLCPVCGAPNCSRLQPMDTAPPI